MKGTLTRRGWVLCLTWTGGGRAVGDRSVVVVVVATSRSPLNLSPFWVKIERFLLALPPASSRACVGGPSALKLRLSARGAAGAAAHHGTDGTDGRWRWLLTMVAEVGSLEAVVILVKTGQELLQLAQRLFKDAYDQMRELAQLGLDGLIDDGSQGLDSLFGFARS